jgi:hypothetical protein
MPVVLWAVMICPNVSRPINLINTANSLKMSPDFLLKKAADACGGLGRYI